jgi:hypothetical protein
VGHGDISQFRGFEGKTDQDKHQEWNYLQRDRLRRIFKQEALQSNTFTIITICLGTTDTTA